jgi:hypothetical protein
LEAGIGRATTHTVDHSWVGVATLYGVTVPGTGLTGCLWAGVVGFGACVAAKGGGVAGSVWLT